MKIVEVAVGVIKQENTIYISKRADDLHQGGKWEFPGGKIEAGETPQACLQRELREELAVAVAVGTAHPPVKRSLDNGRLLVLLPFDCQLVSGTLTLVEHQDLIWTTPKDALGLALSLSDIPIVQRLCS